MEDNNRIEEVKFTLSQNKEPENHSNVLALENEKDFKLVLDKLKGLFDFGIEEHTIDESLDFMLEGITGDLLDRMIVTNFEGLRKCLEKKNNCSIQGIYFHKTDKGNYASNYFTEVLNTEEEEEKEK